MGLQVFPQEPVDFINTGRCGGKELFAGVTVEKDEDLFELLDIDLSSRFHVKTPPDGFGSVPRYRSASARDGIQRKQASSTCWTVRSFMQRMLYRLSSQ